jgi:hypothetical protein
MAALLLPQPIASIGNQKEEKKITKMLRFFFGKKAVM